MRWRLSLAGVVIVAVMSFGTASAWAGKTPPTCAPVSTTAPSLRTLASRARQRLGAADQIASVRIASPPRYFWGKIFGPRNYAITRQSPWVYVRVEPADERSAAGRVSRQRATWQSAMLIQSLHATVCMAGREPEAGDSGQTPHGAEALNLGSGAITNLSLLRDWPYAYVDSRFRSRLQSLARRYDFRVISLVVLHADGDAPQLRIESGHPKQLITQFNVIVRQLEASPTADCWASDACLNGLWIEADDATGAPFLATASVLAGPAQNGGYGAQWVRPGLPYPYPHG
jgi:hypothetical protein